MLAYALSVAAFLAFIMHAVVLTSLMHGGATDGGLDTRVEEVEGLVRKRKRQRAVEVLGRLRPGTPVRQLLLFMLGLELQARTSRGSPGAGYREAPEVSSFEDVVRERIDAEQAELCRPHRSAAVWAVASGPVAALLCLAALVHGANFFRVSSMCGATGAVIGTVIAVSTIRSLYREISAARTRLAAHLRPIEQMDEEDRAAASEARSALTSIDPEADPPFATVVIGIAVVWVAIGFVVLRSGK